MKNTRHEEIVRLVTENIVATQDDLIFLLNKSGFHVTQATVSRDIKKLGLVKTVDNNGVQRYIVHSAKSVKPTSHDYIFSTSVISVGHAVNDIVIRCYPGMANAACAVLDSLDFPEILGTLAGDDTILVIAKSEKDAESLCNKINSLK